MGLLRLLSRGSEGGGSWGVMSEAEEGPEILRPLPDPPLQAEEQPMKSKYAASLQLEHHNNYLYSLIKNIKESARLSGDSSEWDHDDVMQFYMTRGLYKNLNDDALKTVNRRVDTKTIRRLFTLEASESKKWELLDKFSSFVLGGVGSERDYYLLLVKWGWTVNGMTGALVKRFWESLDTFQRWGHRYSYKWRISVGYDEITQFSDALLLVHDLDPRLEGYFSWLIGIWRRGRRRFSELN